MPVKSSATPITIEKSAILSARNAVLSAVVSAVAVTHRLRSSFGTGLPSSSVAAPASSLVSSPVAVRVPAHLGVGPPAGRLEHVRPGEPIDTGAERRSSVPTSSLAIVSLTSEKPKAPTTMAPAQNRMRIPLAK